MNLNYNCMVCPYYILHKHITVYPKFKRMLIIIKYLWTYLMKNILYIKLRIIN